VSHEERISRLRDSGVLTREQAERLTASLSDKPRPVAAHPRPARQYFIWTLAVVLVLLALYSAVGTDTHTQEPQIQDVRTSLNQPQEIGDMGKSLTGGMSVALFAGIPLLALLIWLILLFNGLVSREEEVLETWAQVESNYQRRADLIPNMVETVAKYMRFEQKTLTEVVAERSTAMAEPETLSEQDATAFRSSVEEITEAQEDSAALLKDIKGAPQNEAQLEKLAAAQQALGASMHRFLALSESYPVLRSAEQMTTLQAELEGSENRINVARMRFNEAASEFNAAIRRMPATLVASMGGFKRKAYFQADEGAGKAVKVQFE
jgi:LemA protein